MADGYTYAPDKVKAAQDLVASGGGSKELQAWVAKYAPVPPPIPAIDDPPSEDGTMLGRAYAKKAARVGPVDKSVRESLGDNVLTRALGGTAQGVDDLMRTAASGATFGYADRLSALADEAAGAGDYSANLKREQAKTADIPPVERTIGEIGGGIAGVGVTAPKAAAALYRAAPALRRLPGILKASGAGAGYGAAAGAGNAPEGQQAQGAQVGALIGAALPPVMAGGARVISPAVRPVAQRLMKMGVRLTPGQIVGGKTRRFEEKIKSIPFLGDQIKAAENRAQGDFSIAAYNKALEPAGLKLPRGTGPGRDAASQAYRMQSAAYDDVLQGVDVPPTPRLRKSVSDIRAKGGFGDDMQAAVDDAAERVDQLFKAGTSSAEDVKLLVSDLRKEAANLGRQASGFARRAGQSIDDMAERLNDTLADALGPQQAAVYRNLDKAYANRIPVDVAASRMNAAEGFTPAQLSSGVRAADRSMRKGAFARGEARMQDFADEAEDVLRNRVPNSGTTDRLFAGGLGAGSYFGFQNYPVATTAALAALAGPTAAYTRPGVALMTKALTGRQGPTWQNLAEAVRGGGYPLAPGVAGITERNRK